MKFKIATPYSHLFANASDKTMIIDLSDATEIRGPDQVGEITQPVLWHCELSFVREWAERHTAYLKSMVEGFRLADACLQVASFHLPSRYQVNDVINGAFVGKGEPMSEGEMLANAKANASTMRSILADYGFSSVSLLLENNNHLGTDAYDIVTTPNFISHLLNCTDFGLLLDVAHARITAFNTGQNEGRYLESLPLERAVQIHLSRHSVHDGKAYDTHDALADQDWNLFNSLQEKLPALAYVTIEYYKDVEILRGLLLKLRKEFVEKGRH